MKDYGILHNDLQRPMSDFLTRSTDIMYCSKCGKQLPEGSGFCAYCGQKLSEATTSIDNPTPTVSGKRLNPAASPKEKLPLMLAVIAGMLIISVLLITANGDLPDKTPNITAEQIQSDLIENGADIDTGWWEKLYHLDFSDFTFDDLTITKTLSENDVVYYYVRISGSSYAYIDAPFTVTYKKFAEGWTFVSIRYTGKV